MGKIRWDLYIDCLYKQFFANVIRDCYPPLKFLPSFCFCAWRLLCPAQIPRDHLVFELKLQGFLFSSPYKNNSVSYCDKLYLFLEIELSK